MLNLAASINTKFTWCIAIALCLSVSLVTDLNAQQNFGVVWDIPDSPQQAASQLQVFDEAGISYLEINEIPGPETWSLLQSNDFTLFVQVPIRYPVVQNFAQPDSLFTATIRQYVQAVAGRSSVEALGLFAFGQVQSRSLPDVVAPYVQQIKENTRLQVYYRSLDTSRVPVDSLFDFKVVDLRVDQNFHNQPDSLFLRSGVYLYNPSNGFSSKITPFKWLLEKATIHPETILFMHGKWLFEGIEQYPKLKNILASHAETDDPLFPTPEESLVINSSPSWIVVILILIWGAFLLLFNQNPTYRKSLFRYFIGHRFFVDDIIERQIRVLLPGFLILLLHAALGGVFFYTLGSALFTEQGLNALFQHYPWIAIGGQSHFALFGFGTLLILGFELLCLIWIYFANSKINYLSQMITLYAWPLQLNLVVVTVMVTLLKSGYLEPYLFPLSIVFLGILLIAFTLAAFDTERYLRKYNILFIVGTVGFYSAALVAIFILLITNDYLLNVIRLASSL